MQEADYFFVAYSDVTRCLISYMYFMFLLYQTADSATHRDHIVIRVRREYNNTFWERFCTFGAIRIIRIRFTAGPTGDRVLQVVEYLDVYIICRAEES